MNAGVGRVLRVAAIVGALTALLLAGVADAKPAKGKGGLKLKTASATATATGLLSLASATATCPGKTKAVAGGYTASTPSLSPGAPHWLNVFESQRSGQGAWRVSAVENFPAATDTLKAYVYCEAIKAKVKAASSVVPLSTTVNSPATALASCPKGTRSLSGGFLTPEPTAAASSYVSRSIAANGTGWVVDATNLAGTDARNVTAIAYCATVGKVKSSSASGAVLGPVDTARTVVTPACAKGTLARGGGFATSTPVGGLLSSALVYESRGTGKSWTSSAVASGAATSSTLVTNAYCR